MRAYTNVAIGLHWAAVLIMGFMLTTGYSMDELTIDSRTVVLSQHASAGLLFLLLAVARLLWRFGHPPADLPPSVPYWQAKIANFTHGLFYILLVFVPITGLLAAGAHEAPAQFFGLVDLQGLLGPIEGSDFDLSYSLHKLAVETLLFLVILHVGAALLHLVFDHDGVFQRMLPRLSGDGTKLQTKSANFRSTHVTPHQGFTYLCTPDES